MIPATSIALLACLAQGSTVSAPPVEANLNVYYETDPSGLKFTTRLEGAKGSIYAVFANVQVPGVEPILIGFAPIGEDFVFDVPKETVEGLKFPVTLTAGHIVEGVVKTTAPADVQLGTAIQCDVIDFNFTIGPDDVMVAGRQIDDEWADMGMTVSARNSNPLHPDKAILFDTSMVTGGDNDLATPNPGAFDNDVALGNVLIVAENDINVAPVDANVDDPDDEAAGGSLRFDFENKAAVCSVTLLDIDETPGTQLRFYRNGDLSTPDEVFDIVSLGDGSVQRVDFFEANLDRFEVFFQGSGAVGPIELIPCPRVVNFDETSTGIPRDFQTGEEITNQYNDIGLTFSAVNNNPMHPNKVILFDSENRTGGDDDLLTPNPMVPGNDTPLGKVLIIAENDVDTSPADGLVDDPDDEAAGGQITFQFDYDVTILSARVLDVDMNELDIWRFFDAADMEIGAIVIPDLPDGNVQLVEPNLSGVRRAVLELGGSGAVTRLRFCPDGLIKQVE